MTESDWTIDADHVFGKIEELTKRVERLEREPNYYLLLLSRLGMELGIAFDGTKNDEEVHNIIVNAIRKQTGCSLVDLTASIKYVTSEQKDDSRRRASKFHEERRADYYHTKLNSARKEQTRLQSRIRELEKRLDETHHDVEWFERFWQIASILGMTGSPHYSEVFAKVKELVGDGSQHQEGS